MNERIKQLLIQSEVFNKDGTVLKDVCGYELNKFAELIVRECANICWNQDFVTGSGYADAIEKQFGVE
jgi:hypothetical protein